MKKALMLTSAYRREEPVKLCAQKLLRWWSTYLIHNAGSEPPCSVTSHSQHGVRHQVNTSCIPTATAWDYTHFISSIALDL